MITGQYDLYLIYLYNKNLHILYLVTLINTIGIIILNYKKKSWIELTIETVVIITIYEGRYSQVLW